MLWNKGDVCPAELEDGIIVDYAKGSFIIALKDNVWQEYEIDALQHHKVHISFLYERVCAIFLLTVNDAIETSDASFDIHACDEAQNILSIQKGECYQVEIYLLDKQNNVVASRAITLSLPATMIIHEALQKQMDTPYDDEGFDRALMKIQGVQHPFELEERADVHEEF